MLTSISLEYLKPKTLHFVQAARLGIFHTLIAKKLFSHTF